CEALPKCKASRTNEASGRFTASPSDSCTHYTRTTTTTTAPAPCHQPLLGRYKGRGAEDGPRRVRSAWGGSAPSSPRSGSSGATSTPCQGRVRPSDPPVCYVLQIQSLFFSPVSDRVLVCLVFAERGIYILYDDVKSCQCEDVHVLWSILVESHGLPPPTPPVLRLTR
uniref:Uncharacterized protein n=1 Tax=Aegilops tauschii subsp. strangulata TaxID=200361 RepID=A0A453FNZ4_AEGTS